MKDSFPLFAIALLFLQIQAIGQPGGNPDASMPGNITGKIIDSESKLPLEFATVTLFSTADSFLVTGGVADAKGEFSIEIDFGSYYALVEFISYKALTINSVIVSKSNPTMNLGIVSLDSDAEVLQEVEVRAERSQMQLSLDKKVFNVGKDLANTGGSAVDVLDNVPSVTVDVEGSVSLRGSGGVRILVDGKPSAMVGIGGQGLRNLPANMIERVEIITNPSARYEAEGMSGIINIVLKKNREAGFNGSFDLNAGHPSEYGAAANVNYRKNRLNLFANYGLRYRKSPGVGSQYQAFFRNDTTFITSQKSERERGGWSNFLRAGVDYFFNPKNSISTDFTYDWSEEDNFNEIEYRDFLNDLNNPTRISRRTDAQDEKEPGIEYSLSYKKLFDREGHELNAELQFEDETEQNSSNYVESFFTATGTPTGEPDSLQRSRHTEAQRNGVLEINYLLPVGKEGELEAGYRGSLTDLTNDYLAEVFEDDAWRTIEGLSNNFNYEENIQAAYLIFGNQVKKFSFQGGLRYEFADIRTHLVQTDEINDRRYANLFPSAHLTYELSEGNAFQLSYSRRIRRPGFWELNPFFSLTDARNFWSGNPHLDPEFTDSYELGHIKYWQKATLTSSIFYRRTTGVIERIRSVDAEGNSFTQPENLAERDDYGFEFTWTFDPSDAWRLNGNVNLFRSQTNGKALGQSFKTDNFTAFGRVSSRLRLFKKLDIQTSFNYRALRKTPQGEEKAMYHADLGLSFDFLKNNGTLTLSVRDVFNTRRRRYVSMGEDFFTEGDFQWRARQATLTVSYRLNQQKERERGEDGGGEERSGGEF